MVEEGSRQFSVGDYLVFGTSLMVCAGIGLYQALKNRSSSTSTTDFLMGGRKMKVLPLTISLVVSVISAVTLLGLPAEMYTRGTQYIFNLGSGIGIILTTVIFVPLLHPLQLTSMFEYLERRFESRIARLAGSILEILALLLYGGTALYAPATALEGVTPLSAWMLALILGALVTFYTSLGGLIAVIWTDLIQAFIMLAGILAVIIQGGLSVGGISEIWRLAEEGDRLKSYDFDPDPRTRHTFWGLTFGFAMGSLSFYGASQFTFQRFTATKSTAHAKMTVLLNLPIFYVFHLLLCITGVIIYAYYAKMGCDPIANGDIRSSNQLLPYFVVDVLGKFPVLPGLFLAALTSGALSTISSVMNSISALIWEDLLKDHIKLTESKATLLTRATVVLCGLIIVALTFIADSFGPHIFQVCFAFLGASGGPQLGMFLLGALVPWANWKGAVSGCASGLLMTSWITVGAYLTKPFTPPLPPAPTNYCLPLNTTTTDPIMTPFTTVPLVDGNTTTVGWEEYREIGQGVMEDSSSLRDTLYSVSYTWNTSIGVFTCLIVGLLVSACTEKCKPSPGLVLPWYDHLSLCFGRLRKKKKSGKNNVKEVASNSSLHQIRSRSTLEAEETVMLGPPPYTARVEDAEAARLQDSACF